MILSFITFNAVKSYGQTKIYASSYNVISGNGMSSLVGCGVLYLSPCYTTPTVENAANAVTSDVTTAASVKSSGGLALGIGAYAGELELRFANTLPAGTTTYIRIDSDPTLLNQLLGGNLGGLLAGVVGGVVLGNHSIEVGAKNAAGNNVLSGSSTAGFSTANIRLIRDANGYFYLALKPVLDYDRVYIRDVTSALLLGTVNTTKVYYAFYTSGVDTCAPAFATGFEGSGLTVDVLGLGKAGVTNPGNAIDANTSNYSELSLGALGVAGSISQNFYFSSSSNAGDDFNLRFSVSSALLNAGVLNSLTVSAYNGNTRVFSQYASNLLNLDLLGLLNSGQVVSLPFSPGVPFDRVQVTLSSLLNVNLTQTIFIYGVTRSAGRPKFTLPASNTPTVCYNASAGLTASTANTNELRWYDSLSGGTALETTTFNGTFNTGALTANKTYYVSARRLGCTEESGRVPISITVNPAITFNSITLANATSGFTYSKQIATAVGGTPEFTYTLASGNTLPSGLNLSSGGLIAGTPTVAGNYTFNILATDGKGCTATASYTLTSTAALVFPSGNLPDGIVGTVYPTSSIPSATGGTGPYIYAALNVPQGLNFNPATGEITGTPLQAGIYSFPVSVTDVNGNTVSSTFTVKIINPFVLLSTPLANGITGKPYSLQIIPSATGGNGPYIYAATGLPPGLSFNTITREITGTPTVAGTYTFPVTVNDADGRTTSANFTISVADPLILPVASLADGAVGTVYSPQLIPSASGGSGPYTYVAVGTPPGLNFNAVTREITGTPTQAGNYSVAVTVKDALGATITGVYPLKVTGVLTLPTASLPNGVVGSIYPAQILPAVTGGTEPYIYSIANLPDGLSFDAATRTVSGTPVTGGTFVFSLTATDLNNNKVNTDYTILVTVNPPLLAGALVCAGTSATLTVSNIQVGVTYNWYAAAGNTPLVTNGPNVFTTPVVNEATTFYVEAVSGTARSSRTAVNVSINPAANPAVITTNNLVINAGQKATLTAAADANNTINWYATPSGGPSLGAGSSFTTPSLTSTSTYYVETTNTNGCVSINRVPVPVTVITGAGNNLCNVANAQNSGINGLCLLCSISGAGNSTDADPNNFTRITQGVGVLSTGYQQLIFPSVGTATDSIRLDLGLPTGLLDLSVLGNITVNILNGGNIVGSYQLNASILKLAVLGGTRFKATLAAGSAYDRVELRFGGLATAISSLDIYGATIIYPNPTLGSGSQIICSGNSTVLSATAMGGTSLKWFDAPAGGNVLSSSGSYTTPALTSTTTYYIEVSNGTCPNTLRVPVVVTVTPAISIPVLGPIANTCAGSSATLSVHQPDPLITYNWYTVSSGGIPVFTGTVFSTPALAANTTYYLEAANGSCISSSRIAAIVNVNPRPSSPSVVVSSSSVNSGQTTTLTASSTSTDDTFNWYDSATASTPIYTGSTFVTPPLSGTTSYYVESVALSGCTSSNRVQINITVNGTATPGSVPCEAATAQINGVSGISLLAGIFNPGLAVDNDAQTASTLAMPVGALGAYAYQRLYFGSLSNTGDTLRVLVSFPRSILSAGVLNNISLTTYNGTTSNNDAVLFNNALLNVKLLSGNTQALITLVPAVAFDGAELRLNSGLATALATVNLNYMQRAKLAPKVVLPNVTACLGATALLEVLNPDAGLTYRWFDGNNNVLFDGSSYTTLALTANTKYYVAIVSALGCISAKTEVNVTILSPPQDPVLVSPIVETCINSTVVLQVKNPVNGVKYNWYNSGTLVLADATTLTIPSPLSTTYEVEATNSCGAANLRATATVNVSNNNPVPPVITTSSSTVVSGTSAVLTATASVVGIIRWYSDPATTMLVETGPIFITPPLSSTTTYYATLSSSCRVSATASVTITVVSTAPVATPCGIAGNSIDKSITDITGGGAVLNENYAIDNDINTGSTLFIPAERAGVSVYHRLGFSGGLSNVGDTIRIKISSPEKLLSVSGLSNISLTTYNGSTSNGDGVFLSSNLIKVALASDGSEAILTFVPNVPFDGVELRLTSGIAGGLTSIDFNYAQRSITAPEVNAATLTACQGSAAILTVNNPRSNTTYKWYNGSVYQLGKDGVTFLTDPTLPAGSYDFFVTATGNNNCETIPVKIVINITAPPGPPVAETTNPAVTCSNAPVKLSIQPILGLTYNWYDAAVSGNLLVNNNSSYTTAPNLQPGTYTYYVEAVSGLGCANSSRTAIVLTVNQNALATDIIITGNTNICNSGVVVLTAASTTVTNPVFTWYNDAALTSVAQTGPTFTSPVLNNARSYFVTVSGDNRCVNTVANAKEVILTINNYSTAADIMLNNTTVCAGNSTTLRASSLTVIQPEFNWYSDASLTTRVFTGPTYNVSVIGTTSFYVTVKGSNKCENAAADAKMVTVTVNPIAVTTDLIVNGNTVTCSGSSLLLTATSTTVINPTFTWYSDAALMNIAYVGAAYSTPTLNSNSSYYVTVKGDNKCENSVSTARLIQITVNALPLNPVLASASTTTICSGSSTTLNLQNPQAGVIYEWYNSATGGNLLFTGSSLATPILNASTNYYVSAISAGGCRNASGRILVAVTVNPQPVVPSPVSSTLSICSGGTAALSVSNPQANVIYNWYTSPTGGVVSGSGITFVSPALTSNTTYYVEGVSGGCTSTTRAAVNVIILPSPAPPALINAVNGTICPGNASTLNVVSPNASLTYRWYVSNTGGVALAQGNNFTTASLNATTIFYVESVSSSGCASSTRTPVTVTVLPVLATPLVRIETSTINSITFAWNAIAGATGYEISTDNGLSWQLPSGGATVTKHTIIGLKPDQGVSIQVRAIGQIDCQRSTNSASLPGRAANPLGNQIYIPNVFTPNNDGKNDQFLVYGTTIASVKMKIYTQWGQLIFEVNSTTAGWDGTYKGIAQPNGVYVYLIEAESTDGTKILKKGTVTLIR